MYQNQILRCNCFGFINIKSTGLIVCYLSIIVRLVKWEKQLELKVEDKIMIMVWNRIAELLICRTA